MKERGILFQGAMVRGLLADRKLQTRRAIKAPVPTGAGEFHIDTGFKGGHPVMVESRPVLAGARELLWLRRCPYGEPGDRLWVRETYFAFGRWVTRFNAKKGRDEWHFIDMTLELGLAYRYAADSDEVPHMLGRQIAGATPMWWKRPAIFMPRAASRILLEVTEIRVERLQDISEADAIAEGIPADGTPCPRCHSSGWVMQGGDPVECDAVGCGDGAVDEYRTLWESINGAGSWDLNPYVWAVSFKRVTP